MSGILRPVVLFTAGLLFAAVPALAQPDHIRSSGRDAIGAEAPYNPGTEITLRGTVQEVTHRMQDIVTVTHLVIVTPDHATTVVHLGPSSWLARQAMSFTPGDAIEVIGSRVKYGGAEVVVARQIRKGGHTWTLREMDGTSKWSLGLGR